MKKLLYVFAFLFLPLVNGLSQDTLLILHPVVGDTIDKNDKIDFSLFPEIDNSTFKHCFIKYSAKKFYLNSFTLTGSSAIRPIDTTEIRQYMKNIDILVDYYASEIKRDSAERAGKVTLNLNNPNPNNVNPRLISNDTRNKIIYEMYQNERLKADAERMKLDKQGLDVLGNGMRVEWSRRKR